MKRIRFSLLGGLIFFCPLYTLLAQEVAPNDLPVPWYSQYIMGNLYPHSSLASSLMVFDYLKGIKEENQRSPEEAEKKLVEYQTNYFLKKEKPFQPRRTIADGEFYAFEIDSLSRYYEKMEGTWYEEKGTCEDVKGYINEGLPVLVNVVYKSPVQNNYSGNPRHWVVVRGIDDEFIWINDPGYDPAGKARGKNCRIPLKRDKESISCFEDLWNGRYMIIVPRGWKGELKNRSELIPFVEVPASSGESSPENVPVDVKQLIK